MKAESKFIYKFIKILSNGAEKQVLVTNSTLDVEYHAYIDSCRANKMHWKLVRIYDGKIMFEG